LIISLTTYHYCSTPTPEFTQYWVKKLKEPHPISNKDLETNNPFVVEILKTGIEINLKTPYIKSD